MRASSVSNSQLNILLRSRRLAEPSIIMEPSDCWVTSSSMLGAVEVVKSPTISSKISSNVTSPLISPYSSTTKPMRSLFARKFASCVFNGVLSGMKYTSSAARIKVSLVNSFFSSSKRNASRTRKIPRTCSSRLPL